VGPGELVVGVEGADTCKAWVAQLVFNKNVIKHVKGLFRKVRLD